MKGKKIPQKHLFHRPGTIVTILLIIFFVLLLVSGACADAAAGAGKEDLVRITSLDELRDFLNTQMDTYEESPWYQPWMDYIYEETSIGTGMTRDEDVSQMKDTSQEYMSSPSVGEDYSSTHSSETAADYSTTNIQVAGVDEADRVKNDGKYIYIADGDTLTIIDAYPAESARIVSNISSERQIQEVFISGDTLVLFTEGSGEEWITPENSAAPILSSSEKTYAELYSVQDRSSPDKLTEIQMPGSYEQGRMVGDVVYAYTGEYIYDPYDAVMPVIRQGESVVASPEIWAPRIPRETYVMHTLTAFKAAADAQPDAESFLIGDDNTLYASPDSIYIGYTQYDSDTPVMYEESDTSDYYSPETKTVLHRFSIDGEKIDYQSSGVVPGTLLNQFSLDEYKSNLRVATTQDYDSESGMQSSNVYVLKPDLSITGSLTGLAPGEKIYSARFMGDKLYLVTFREMDPLFVIDLSDPAHPQVLGELKIPGYSDYLHPYDDTHLIGIGKDTQSNEWGGVSAAGLKFALFDVSDVSNPKVIDSVILGESGSTSPVLSDHRAFLLDTGKNILVLPVCLIQEIETPASGAEDEYQEDSWTGAMLYGVEPDIGFIEKARIQQGDDGSSCWYGDGVYRSLFMDDVLYTISDTSVLMTDLTDPESQLGEIILKPDDNSQYYNMAVE